MLIAKCIDALGQNEFYDQMLDLLGHAIRHDLAALVRYSRSAKPDLVIPRIELTDIRLQREITTIRQGAVGAFGHWRVRFGQNLFA